MGVVGNIILFYLVNNLLNWNLTFITPEFNQVLPILNLLILINIGSNIVFLTYFRSGLYSLIQVLLNILGYNVAWTFYDVFPFSFNVEFFTYAVKFALIVIMIVSIIVAIIEALKFILNHVLKISN